MSKKPMYEQIKEEVKNKIKNGEFPAGKPLPTQIELANMFDTSEITSRRALSELVNEGLIYRIRGKGTFVKESSEKVENVARTTTLKRIYFVYPNTPIEEFNHPFFDELLGGIHEQCQKGGIEFLIWNYEENEEIPEGEENGFIILSQVPGRNGIFSNSLERWKQEGKRMMTVHFYYPHLQIPYLVVDNMSGGFFGDTAFVVTRS